MRALFLGLGIALTPAIAFSQQAQRTLQTDPGSDYFIRARQLYDAAVVEQDQFQQKALFERSIPILEDYLRAYPRHKHAEAATYYLAECYHNTGMPRQAGMIYDQIIQKFRTGQYVAAAAYRLAYENYNAKQYQRAARLFGLTADNASKPEDKLRSVYFRAQCYLLLNDQKRALPLLEEVANSPIDSPYKNQAKIAQAHILLADKKYAEALPIYEAFLTPNQPPELAAETHYHAGVAAAALKENGKAKKHFKATIEGVQSPWKSNAHIALLGLHYQERDFDAVLKQLDSSKVELDKEQLGKQGVIVGQVYFQKKNYPEAINFFLDVERSTPGSDAAFEAAYYKLLSLYNIDAERIPKMVDQFVQNYAVGRGTSKYIHQALLMKAESLYADKEYKEAAEAYNAINPKYIDDKNRPSMLYKKAWCLAETNNYEGARDAFGDFIKLAPEDKRIFNAYAKRGQANMELGDRVNALRDFDKVINSAPKSQIAAMALQLSARIQRDAKNYDDVIDRLENLLKDYPKLEESTKANSHYWLGSAYFKQDNFKNAIPHLEAAKQMDAAAYGKQTSMLLVLARYTLKDVDGLKKALDSAERIELNDQIPLPVYRWLGSQRYKAGDYADASKYLEKGCEKGVPQKTPAVVWRLLAKSQLRTGNFKQALQSVDNLLTLEDEDARKVEAMLDKTNILIGLKQLDDAKAVGEEALAMRPSGQSKAGLLLSLGDTAYQQSNFTSAAEHYVLIVENFPELGIYKASLDKLIDSLTKAGKSQEATDYKKILQQKYPNQ
ncbi:tetratricopeptide repeat protein [Rubritalea sp.]|uniref:tetratricopeptide repeat protein n=1 Tax=Rubritalea sp. TaxID=2109375 RepID=UPI003EF71A40